MANPGDFAYTVKQQADIVRILGDYVKLKKAGAQNFSGLCPFHGEKTPSFSVHATRQFFHCFGCGASGDVLSFIQKIENITFHESRRSRPIWLGMIFGFLLVRTLIWGNAAVAAKVSFRQLLPVDKSSFKESTLHLNGLT